MHSEKIEQFRNTINQSLVNVTGPRRDELTVLSTVLWYWRVQELLRPWLGNRATPYAIERHLEPEGFGRTQFNEVFRRRKWDKYAVGAHQPSNTTVNKVEAKVPGSAWILRHPMWEILRQPDRVLEKKESWLFRLTPDIQRIVFVNDPKSSTRKALSSPDVTEKHFQQLELRAGLDSLACLAILLAENIHVCDGNNAIHIGDSLYRTLLIYCAFEPYLLMAGYLFKCFRDRLLNQVVVDNVRLDLDSVDFYESAFLLHRELWKLMGDRKIGWKREDRTLAGMKLLRGKFGFDAMWGLSLLHVPAEPNSKKSHKHTISYERDRKLRDWGLYNLRNGIVGNIPPHDIL
ncbi:hypothetical protein [Acidithiobacillus thiooxidans]|uniref:hypothetical protein n=1 Tax=Acidithiobacillus thiooxidans TaxID=930 RepID=UPI00356199D1